MAKDYDVSGFDQAAEEAKKEFDEMIGKLTPEQRSGIVSVQGWIKTWFMSAGLKRLMRILRDYRF